MHIVMVAVTMLVDVVLDMPVLAGLNGSGVAIEVLGTIEVVVFDAVTAVVDVRLFVTHVYPEYKQLLE